MAIKDSFKLCSESDIRAEQEEKEKERVRQHWLKIERNRKEQEKYKTKEISGWMYFGPFLGMLVAAIAGLMIWLSGASDTSTLWWIVGIGMAPLMLLGFTSSVDGGWKASVAAKREVEEEAGRSKDDDLFSDFDHSSTSDWMLNGYKYEPDYIYTDSAISYWFYNLTKFVMGLSTIGFGILAAILLFMWLGSISIAPTTIIIILLVLILLK